VVKDPSGGNIDARIWLWWAPTGKLPEDAIASDRGSDNIRAVTNEKGPPRSRERSQEPERR
jgi:hypothetical protein